MLASVLFCRENKLACLNFQIKSLRKFILVMGACRGGTVEAYPRKPCLGRESAAEFTRLRYDCPQLAILHCVLGIIVIIETD